MSITVPQPTSVPLEPVARLFEQSLSIRHVYGEPIQRGDVTVVPVAKVAFGFGGGFGSRAARRRRGAAGAMAEAIDAGAATESRAEPEGAGAGGGARMTPVGALEIGPRGTRFVPIDETPRLLGALAMGIGAGMLLGRRRRQTGTEAAAPTALPATA